MTGLSVRTSGLPCWPSSNRHKLKKVEQVRCSQDTNRIVWKVSLHKDGLKRSKAGQRANNGFHHSWAENSVEFAYIVDGQWMGNRDQYVQSPSWDSTTPLSFVTSNVRSRHCNECSEKSLTVSCVKCTVTFTEIFLGLEKSKYQHNGQTKGKWYTGYAVSPKNTYTLF